MPYVNPIEADLHLGQGDTLPIAGPETISDANGEPVDLTGVAVTFTMHRLPRNGPPAVQAAGIVVDAAAGTVSYAWQDGDTDVAGKYEAWWTAVVAGKQFSAPNTGKLIVLIEGR
jgi:hypothetical protein